MSPQIRSLCDCRAAPDVEYGRRLLAKHGPDVLFTVLFLFNRHVPHIHPCLGFRLHRDYVPFNKPLSRLPSDTTRIPFPLL
jgi:hypothetical protein